MNEETQMTVTPVAGASSAKRCNNWLAIPWPKAKAQVFRLQTRIAKAEREGRVTISSVDSAGLSRRWPYASLSGVR